MKNILEQLFSGIYNRTHENGKSAIPAYIGQITGLSPQIPEPIVLRAQNVMAQQSSPTVTMAQQMVGAEGIARDKNGNPIPIPTLPDQPTSTPNPIPTLTARRQDANKFNPSSDVVNAIHNAAQKYKVNEQLLTDIGLSESGLKPDNSARKGGLNSSAAGLYMFIDATWKNTMKALGLPETTPKSDPKANAEAAAYLISKGRLGSWDASKPVWGKYYSPKELAPYYSR